MQLCWKSTRLASRRLWVRSPSRPWTYFSPWNIHFVRYYCNDMPTFDFVVSRPDNKHWCSVIWVTSCKIINSKTCIVICDIMPYSNKDIPSIFQMETSACIDFSSQSDLSSVISKKIISWSLLLLRAYYSSFTNVTTQFNVVNILVHIQRIYNYISADTAQDL